MPSRFQPFQSSQPTVQPSIVPGVSEDQAKAQLMADYQQGMPAVATAENETKFNQHVSNQQAAKSEDGDMIAKNLLFEASLLEDDARAFRADAEAKRERAYAISPNLRPGAAVVQAPLVSTPVKEMVVPVPKPAKITVPRKRKVTG